ncbi:hypothetical protein BBJ29_006099 [Phytophthora kernoviae]|uniref:RING-type domain-containing protein n=1 Tax=Phytophthora kernoviae TaxID=325452 RepID=A0A3F2RIB3_9STRA|nr:hypothetical protein BBJ29_006099 [Phytophthora kernoviae]RLN57773.1 hypothetical protein BBP00_00007358 [Phytophthora kernoviae]
MPPNGDAAPAAVRNRPLLHYKDLGLGTQNRKIRFTCVHASENFLACGANNGSVYLYATSALSRTEGDSRLSSGKYHLVKMITPPSNDRVSVTCLSIDPQQKRLIVGTMRGVVYAIQLSDYHKIGEKVEFSHDFHAGFPITCFLWDRRGTRLFSACNAGLVCQTVLRAGMSAIFGSTDTELLLKEETGIVQLDLAKSGRSYILMVSSQLRVLLLNLTSGDGRIQPRNLTINKLGRFQFLREPPYAPQDVKDAATLLVSWNVGSSVLFFLDPFAVEITEWHLDLGIIHDLKIVNETTLVVLHGEAPKVSMVQSCSADQFLQIYGSDVKKAVELAVGFNLNDAEVVGALQTQWLTNLQKIAAKPEEYDDLTTSLKALVEKTKALEEEYRMATEAGLPMPTDSQPLQIIFKQRPQQAMSASDLFADSAETEVTLATGNALHKPIEYFDVLAPSDQSYSKSICAVDGSTMEARLMDIPELPRTNFVLADDFRENYMEEIMEEVQRCEHTRNEEGAMNMNLLPALKDGSTAAAKAFSTFIPGSSMLTHLMDGSIITDPFGRSDASGIFSNFPEYDEDELVIDPDPRLLQRRYTHGQRLSTGAKEYSVLRIAMSTIGEADESNLDTEVLMEAISLDIWDTNLKYTSNMPISEQLNLSEGEMERKENGRAHSEWNVPAPYKVMTLEPRYQWDSDGGDLDSTSATAVAAEAFVAKYGVYINPDLAAEVCNLRQFTGALKIVLDEVVSSADMEETCEDIVSWISDQESGKAFTALKERDSLCLLLHLLDILLKKCPEEAIEMCVSKYPILYPWNIKQALFGTELEWAAKDDAAGIREILKPNTVAQTSKYFRYLVRLLEEKGDEAGRDAQIVSRCLDLCFAGVTVVGDLFDREERPNRIAWVAGLVRQPQKFIYDHSKCWGLFAKDNAFPALLELILLSLEDGDDPASLKRGFNELNELVTLITKNNSNLDVILLPCGHAFHEQCMEDDYWCPVCLEANLNTLDFF